MEKIIQLLKDQIAKQQAKDFNLEAWKSSTNVLLGRIFGNDSPKIQEINKIKYEHGSWALRDTSGTINDIDTCKKRGIEIIESSISEIENFGIPDKTEDLFSIQILTEALESNLTVSTHKALLEILKNDKDKELNTQKIIDLFAGLNHKAEKILADILLHQNLKRKL